MTAASTGPAEQIPLSDELFAVMRGAAQTAMRLHEPFITPRALLLALLDDASVGPAIAAAIDRDKVLGAQAGENPGMVRLMESGLPEGEQPSMVRYDTLAFKTPDGASSVWLNRDAYRIFVEGAQRVEDRYYPKQLAFGLAAEAVHAPGMLSEICVEPGALVEAIYRL